LPLLVPAKDQERDQVGWRVFLAAYMSSSRIKTGGLWDNKGIGEATF
jgi:hypothetical protein